MIIIEGARNTGKTYLLSRLNGYTTYKVPFISYFNAFLKGEDFVESNADSGAYHFTTGNDVAILSMHRMGLISKTLFDRGFLSNVVLAVQQGRITEQQGMDYIDWLIREQYTEYVVIVYVDGKRVEDDRNKDEWSILDQDGTKALFDKFIGYIGNRINIVRFYNSFGEGDVEAFQKTIDSLNNSLTC